MKKSYLYALPVALCIAAFVLLGVHYPANSSIPRQKMASVPVMAPAEALASVDPASGALQSELVALKRDYERLMTEKQKETDARKESEKFAQQMQSEKGRLDAALAQIQQDRISDATRFSKDQKQAVAALEAEKTELYSKLNSTIAELEPLKAREVERKEALRRIPAPAIITP